MYYYIIKTQIETLSGVASLFPLILSNVVEPGKAYFSPAVLKTFQCLNHDDDEATIFNSKVKIETPTKEPEILKVLKLEVSAMNCQLLNELSPQDVDSLLEEFFRIPKIFPLFVDLSTGKTKSNFFQINIFENLTPKTEHLRWDLKSQNSRDSLYFHFDNFETEFPIEKYISASGRVTAMLSACSRFTSLMLNSRALFEPLPSETKTFCPQFNLAKGYIIFENLPPTLEAERNKLTQMVTSFMSGKSKGKPVLLCFGPRGCGKRDVFSSLSLKLGLPLVTYDSGLLLGDSSGATEAKMKRIFTQVCEEQSMFKNV